MERRSIHKRRFLAAIGATVFTLTMAWPAPAGVVFFNRAEEKKDDGYPESRFGEKPVQPLGRAVPRRTRGGRSPAGMEFADGGSTGESSLMRRELERSDAKASAGAKSEKAPGTGDPADIIPDRAKGVQEVALIANDLGFFPKTVFVTRDIPVRMYVTGASKNRLCIMMDTFQVRKQVKANEIEEITFTPSMPGKYRFYCPVNGAEGTLVVRELTTTYVSSN